MSSTAAAQSTESTSSLPDPLDVIASFGKKLFGAKDLKKGLKLAGHELTLCVGDLLDSGVLKSLGNAHSVKGGKVDHQGPTRFRANLLPEGGKFWVRLLSHLGTPAIVPGAGQVTSFGSLVELTGLQRQLLESRDCPVEVIADPESIAQLVKTEAETAKSRAESVDKQAPMLAEFA